MWSGGPGGLGECGPRKLPHREGGTRNRCSSASHCCCDPAGVTTCWPQCPGCKAEIIMVLPHRAVLGMEMIPVRTGMGQLRGSDQ
jgi:hypothetical protein